METRRWRVRLLGVGVVMRISRSVIQGLRRAAVGVAALLMTGCLFAGEQPIVFVSEADGAGELFLMDPESGDATRLTENGGSQDPRWSPDSGQVAFLSDESGATNIFVYDRKKKTAYPLIANAGVTHPPVWSPESDALAFVSPRDGSPEIYSVGTVTDNDLFPVFQVTVNELDERLGDWHPEGAWIVFADTKSGADGEPGLWLRNAEGVDQIRLTRGNDTDASWSPDGQRVAFVRVEGGDEDIYALAPVSGWRGEIREIPLARGPASDHLPAWSPDSKSIAFVSGRDGNPEIYVMRADGNKPRRLTFNDGVDQDPVWSPDGKRIAFVSYVYGQGEILVMDADGANQRRLTNNTVDDHSPDW